MALTARPTSLTAAPSAPTGRISSGARQATSLVGTSIDELGSSASLQPNTKFSFEGFSDWTKRYREPNPEPLTNTASSFETFSATFINLLDQEQTDGGTAQEKASQNNENNPNYVSKAIQAYEGTSLVIHGQAKPLGNTVSITL